MFNLTRITLRAPLKAQTAAFTTLLLLALTGCLGGGGATSGGGDSGDSSVPPPPLPPTRADFETSEYFTLEGMDRINASAAYVEGYTGAGVTVAQIGLSGLIADEEHMNVISAVQVSGLDLLQNNSAGFWAVEPAGILGQHKDDQYFHGVAYDVDIISVRVDWDEELTVGVQYAAGTHLRQPPATADIIQINKWYSTAPSPETMAIFEESASLDTLHVFMAGDNFHESVGGSPLPDYHIAADPRLLDTAIVVGSVDPDNNISFFSNRAGEAKDRFMVAPGEFSQEILVPYSYLWIGERVCDYWVCWYPTEIRTATTPLGSGSYLAASFVSGAAAILKQAFPYLASSEITDILLTSATDLGAEGVDEIYGHGLLNLETAMQPIGTLSVPLTNDPDGLSAEIATTSLALGPAFGDALEGDRLLANATALDEYNRSYRFDLDSRVLRAERLGSLVSFTAPAEINVVSGSPWSGANVAFGLQETSPDYGEPLQQVHGANIGFSVNNTDRVYLLSDSSPHELFTSDKEAGLLFSDASDIRMPQLSLSGDDHGAAWKHKINDGTDLTVGWFSGKKGSEDWGGIHKSSLAQAMVSHSVNDAMRLAAGAGMLTERGATLASAAEGGFGALGRTNSTFLSLAGHLELSPRLALEASYTHAWADLSRAESGMLNDWRRIEANATGLSLLARDLFLKGDHAGIMVSQPLRVSQGSAILTVPIARDLHGNIVRESEPVDLSPSGREVDLRLAYRTALGEGAHLQAFMLLRNQPGHDADAGQAGMLGAKLNLEF